MYKEIEIIEINVNMSLVELLANINKDNATSVFSILKVKYGISYTKISEAMGIAGATLRTAMKYKSFEGVLSDINLKIAIDRFKRIYLN